MSADGAATFSISGKSFACAGGMYFFVPGRNWDVQWDEPAPPATFRSPFRLNMLHGPEPVPPPLPRRGHVNFELRLRAGVFRCGASYGGSLRDAPFAVLEGIAYHDLIIRQSSDECDNIYLHVTGPDIDKVFVVVLT